MEFLADHPMYVAVTIAAIILLGILAYLWGIDARLRRLEARSASPGPAQPKPDVRDR